MSRGTKLALGVLAVLGVLVALVMGLLSNRDVTTKLGHEALRRLAEQIPADVQFSHLSVNPAKGTIAVDDLAVTVPGKPNEKFVATKQVILDVDMAALVTGKVHVQRIHAVNPEATIIHRGNNHYNFEEVIPKKKEEPKSGTSVLTLDRVTFEGGRVTYIDKPRDIEAELPHLDGSLQLDLARNDVKGQVTLSDAWARYETFKQPVESFLGAFHFNGEDLHLDKLKVDAGQTGIAVQGDVLHLASSPGAKAPVPPKGGAPAPKAQTNPEFRLSGQVKTQLAQWAPLVKQPMSGFARADVELRGTAKAPKLAGELHGTHLAFRTYRVEDLFSRLTADKDGADVSQLKADVWGGRLNAKGHVPFKKTGPLDVTATAERVDLAVMRRQLNLKLKGELSGHASAHVQAKSPSLDPKAIAATGWLRAEGRVPVKDKSLPAAVKTDARWADGVLTLRNTELRALGGRLTGRGQIAPLAKDPTYSVDATVRDFELAALDPLLPKPLPVRGRVTADVSVLGHGFKTPVLTGSARVATRATLEKGAAGNKADLPFNADARLGFAGRTVTLKALNANALGGSLAAQGTVTLGSGKPAIDLTAQAHGISLAELNRTFQLAKGPVAGDVSASVAYRGETLVIRDATARTLGGVVVAKGQVQTGVKPPRYALDVSATGINLTAVNRTFQLAELPVSGTAGAMLKVSGAGPDFRATGPIRMQGLAAVPDRVAGVQNRLPFNVNAQVAVSRDGVQFSPLNAKIGGSTLTAQGAIHLNGASNLTFSGHIVDTPAIAALFGAPDLDGGKLTLVGSASGPRGAVRLSANVKLGETALKNQLSLDGATFTMNGLLNGGLSLQGALQATNLEAGGQTFESISSPFKYVAPRDALGKGTLTLPGLTALMGGSRLLGNATLHLDSRTYAVKLRSEGLTLKHLNALSAQSGEGVPLNTAVRLDVDGKGRFDAPALKARVELSPFKFQDRTFGTSVLNADVAKERILVNGNVFGRQIDLDGRVGLKPGEDGHMKVRFNNSQLGALFSLVPSQAAESVELPVGGVLTGTVDIRGPFTRVQRLVADVDLSQLVLVYDDLKLQNEGPLRMRYGQSRLTLTQFHLVGGGTDLVAKGVLGIGVPSSLSATGKVNLALLEKISPKNLADASGTATLDAQLRGTLGRPDVLGALTIRNGEFSTRNLPQTVRDLNGTIRLVRDRVFLDSLNATLGYTGKVQAFGGATLGQDLMPTYVNLELTAREIEARMPDVNVLVNADLAFSGTPDATRLDGQVRVLQGKITKDVDLTGGLLAGPKGGRAAPSKLGDVPFVKNLTLRTQVLVPDQFFIDNNLAKGELRGDLLVLGTIARPILVGRAEAITGEFYFQDHTYTLEEASVDFIDPHKLTPYMHVVATTAIQGFDVRMNVNGTPEQFKLDLSSTPFLPDQDILTLIATGQTPAQLTGGSGESSVATAGNFLLNRITKGVEQGATEQGVVDVLRIQPGSTDPTQTTGGSFTVGKRLSEKLMVTYTQDLLVAPGQAPGRLFIFDYLLTDQVALKLEQRLSGGYNASARYRFTMR